MESEMFKKNFQDQLHDSWLEKFRARVEAERKKRPRCPRCNRQFKSLNLHDKTSRCGRVAGLAKIDRRKTSHRDILKADQERINQVGLDKAIKKQKGRGSR